MKKCPQCGKPVQDGAGRCPFCLGDLHGEQRAQAPPVMTTKKCPFCAEDIQVAAVVCKHCGRDLKGGASQVQIVQPKKKTGCVAMGCAVVLAMFGVVWVVTMLGHNWGTVATSPPPSPPPTPALTKSAPAGMPPYRVFSRITPTAAEKAEEAASIKAMLRRNPNDPNATNRKPADLVLSVAIANVDRDGCLAVAKDLIGKEKLGTQTVRVFFYESPDIKTPGSGVAEYNIEWSRADGFHAGGLGQAYHALGMK